MRVCVCVYVLDLAEGWRVYVCMYVCMCVCVCVCVDHLDGFAASVCICMYDLYVCVHVCII